MNYKVLLNYTLRCKLLKDTCSVLEWSSFGQKIQVIFLDELLNMKLFIPTNRIFV